MAGMKGGKKKENGFYLLNRLNYFMYYVFVTIMRVVCCLVTLAFAGSIGMTLVILACALPQFGVWWPFVVVLFYILAPLPTIIARRYTEHTGASSANMDLAIFITMGFVVSSFALPITLARTPGDVEDKTIQMGACYLTLAGNIVVYLTYIGFFVTLYQDDSDYSMW